MFELKYHLGEMTRTHGMTNTRVYRIWATMFSRCYNKNTDRYKNYGGRGISVCDEWFDFECFYSQMGEPKDNETLQRKNVDKGYSLENCKWADKKEQYTHRTDSRKFTINGETLCLFQWCTKYGVSSRTIAGRLRKGMPIEEALNKPVRPKLSPVRPK